MGRRGSPTEVSVRKVGMFYWLGRVVRVVVGVDFTPDLVKEFVDSASHRFVVDRIALAISEQPVYDSEQPLDALKPKFEEAVRSRHGPPGLVQVNLS